jgi:hypothetical protein
VRTTVASCNSSKMYTQEESIEINGITIGNLETIYE